MVSTPVDKSVDKYPVDKPVDKSVDNFWGLTGSGKDAKASGMISIDIRKENLI